MMMIFPINYPGGGVNRFATNESTTFWRTDCFSFTEGLFYDTNSFFSNVSFYKQKQNFPKKQQQWINLNRIIVAKVERTQLL